MGGCYMLFIAPHAQKSLIQNLLIPISRIVLYFQGNFLFSAYLNDLPYELAMKY